MNYIMSHPLLHSTISSSPVLRVKLWFSRHQPSMHLLPGGLRWWVCWGPGSEGDEGPAREPGSGRGRFLLGATGPAVAPAGWQRPASGRPSSNSSNFEYTVGCSSWTIALHCYLPNGASPCRDKEAAFWVAIPPGLGQYSIWSGSSFHLVWAIWVIIIIGAICGLWITILFLNREEFYRPEAAAKHR